MNRTTGSAIFQGSNNTAMNKYLKTYLFLFFAFLASCQHGIKVDFEKETQDILSLEEKAREYHFSKNARTLVNSFSDRFLSINKGNIDSPTNEESFQKFDAYFKRVSFLKWDNKQPPIVRFSEDATVAYVAVDKLVIVAWEDEANETTLDTTHFAWLSVYKKTNDSWKLDCIASTHQ